MENKKFISAYAIYIGVIAFIIFFWKRFSKFNIFNIWKFMELFFSDRGCLLWDRHCFIL